MATQSLYRRYRPRRFSELKGQDHVVRALRDAVAQGREGQAYLFSGPRGTGKTTSARILAKVLNCDNVVDGEPCCMCESCKAVEHGTSYDVHELDAASNNGVDAIRDLVEKASLGSPGRHKVYILDEVHMLSKAAEAALLKTLEEPPPHVVFVLATTDPQKMSDTIRSRTQHLQFHLLPSDTLAEHVKWVAEDAGYDLPQAALDAALVRGGGSARDTLSALELLASTGGDTSDIIDLDEFLTALIDRDPGRVLTAMGHAVSMGRDPRTITEDLVRHLRNAFLSLMAPELVVLPPDQLDLIAGKAQELGAAGLVRAIERLGEALVDMRHAPDPRILVEVALVQLTSDQAGGDATAFAARIDRLEAQLHALRERGPAAEAAQAPPRDPQTGRAKLGGAATRSSPAGASSPASDAPSPNPPTDGTQGHPSSGTTGSSPPAGAPPQQAVATDDRSRSEPTDRPSGAPGAGAGAPMAADPPRPVAATMTVPEAWNHTVKSQLKGLARPLFAAGEFVGERDGAWLFEVPNEAHGTRCEAHRADVEALLSAAVGSPVTIRIVAEGGGASGTPAPATTPAPAPAAAPAAEPAAAAPPAESAIERAARAAAAQTDDEPAASAYVPPPDDEVDLSELTDAPPDAVKSPIDRLAEAFPGSELMRDD